MTKREPVKVHGVLAAGIKEMTDDRGTWEVSGNLSGHIETSPRLPQVIVEKIRENLLGRP